MAWLEKRSGSYHLALARELIEHGEIEIPNDVDFATFVLSDGKLARPVIVKALTLRDLLRQYEAALQLM